MSDLVKRLRNYTRSFPDLADVARAADEIERLQRKCDYKDEVIEQRNAECSRQFKEIERLRAVLERIANGYGSCGGKSQELAREVLNG